MCLCYSSAICSKVTENNTLKILSIQTELENWNEREIIYLYNDRKNEKRD